MNKKNRLILAFGLCMCPLLIVTGCYIEKANYQRTENLSVPLAPGSNLIAETSFGSITITGADIAECNVIATISAGASTEEEAKKIAEKVKIETEFVDKTLTVKAKKPQIKKEQSIGVSYEIIVPKQTDVECSSSFGAIKLADINGNAKAKTSSGSITAENIKGSARLDTSFGSINCNNISGENVELKSSSGAIKADNIQGLKSVQTSFGSVTCNNVSGNDARLKTNSGKIILKKAAFSDCDVDTSFGSIISTELKADALKLNSGSGSIKVEGASANTTNIHTSFGRITCRRITSADLTAGSNSGNIDIVCSDSTPAEINANVTTSFGSIDFVAPPGFSGQVELATNLGSINTNLPITITGEVSNKRLTGKIGEGKGKLHLETKNGSIKIK
jgi:DUF4097 and DUF4098 domain-containing protein YvlB